MFLVPTTPKEYSIRKNEQKQQKFGSGMCEINKGNRAHVFLLVIPGSSSSLKRCIRMEFRYSIHVIKLVLVKYYLSFSHFIQNDLHVDRGFNLRFLK